MHYYIISGELSGDIYGAKLIEALRKIDLDSQFTSWGGENMKNIGGNVVVDLERLAFMGFWEVFKNSRIILRNLIFAKNHIKKTNPDAIILIDYPGFNLRVAKYAKKMGIPVFWFIAPQVWAWKKGRIQYIKEYVNRLFVVFPFELNYFQKKGVNALYFGHPMIDIIKNDKNLNFSHNSKSTIALLPGSRKQEVQAMLPIMLEASRNFPKYKFVVICAPSIKKVVYENLINGFNVELKFNKDILYSVSAAVVASGTASLELAIYKVPQVVCYKLNFISFILARIFATVKYISLVNILADKFVVDELIQYNCNSKNITSSLSFILKDNNHQEILSNYSNIISKLGGSGCFSKISSVIYRDLLGTKKHANI